MTQSQLRTYHLDTTLSVNAFLPEIERAATGILEAVIENMIGSPNCYNEEQEVADFTFNNAYDSNTILFLKDYLSNLAVCLVKYGAEKGLDVTASVGLGRFTSNSVNVTIKDEKDPSKSYIFRLDYGPIEGSQEQRFQSNLMDYQKSFGKVFLKITEKSLK